MRAFTSQRLVALVAASSAIGVNAWAVPALPKREMLGLNVWELYRAVKEFLQTKNAFDPDVPDKCVLTTSTVDGGNCHTVVTCDDKNTVHDMGVWNVCYLGGVQYFTDPDLGDFSVTMTQAGGVNGNTQDGLHHPVFAFANINNWEPWPVQDMTDQNTGNGGALCGTNHQGSIHKLEWGCGIPRISGGARSLFGNANIPADSNQAGYKPGWCTAHIIQFQKNEYGNGPNFAFAAQMFDAAGAQIGHIDKTPVADDGTLAMSSKLPYLLTFKVGAYDSDPVQFCYAGECWSCDDHDGGAHLCTLGNGKQNGYENGDREGDMGWSC